MTIPRECTGLVGVGRESVVEEGSGGLVAAGGPGDGAAVRLTEEVVEAVARPAGGLESGEGGLGVGLEGELATDGVQLVLRGGGGDGGGLEQLVEAAGPEGLLQARLAPAGVHVVLSLHD